MRLRAEVWVRAYLKICTAKGAFATVVRHGDDDAGTIFIRINQLDGTSRLFAPAPAGLAGLESERRWHAIFGGAPATDDDVDAYLAREVRIDGDLWIVEVEDRSGEHHLGEWLAG